MQHSTSYRLLTFYKFVDIDNPEEEVAKHKQFCTDIGMMGRIYIGEEGISATATCNLGQLEAYKRFLKENPYFSDLLDEIESKATEVKEHEFDKMIVKYRKEIVALGKQVSEEKIEKANKTISPEELKRIIEEDDPNWEILDMRNDYEWQLGHFKGAKPAGTINFREVQELIDRYKKQLKDKKVVMYCTGGIRCEKLSALLDEEGVDNFYGLEGGVVQYTNQFKDGNRLGSLYTFDGRVSCQVNDETTHKTIATCIYTDAPTDNCENCRYSPCNARIIADPQAYRKHFGFCSQQCAERAQDNLLVKNIERDPLDYKALRGKTKQDPTQKDTISKKISNRIKKHLLHTEFRHKEPQKEDVVYEW